MLFLFIHNFCTNFKYCQTKSRIENAFQKKIELGETQKLNQKKIKDKISKPSIT